MGRIFKMKTRLSTLKARTEQTRRHNNKEAGLARYPRPSKRTMRYIWRMRRNLRELSHRKGPSDPNQSVVNPPGSGGTINGDKTPDGRLTSNFPIERSPQNDGKQLDAI